LLPLALEEYDRVVLVIRLRGKVGDQRDASPAHGVDLVQTTAGKVRTRTRALGAAAEVVHVQTSVVPGHAVDVRAEVTEFRMGSGVGSGVRGPAADQAELVALAVADTDLVDARLVLRGDDGPGRRVQILRLSGHSDGVVEAGRRGGDVHATSGNLGIAEGDDGDVAGDQVRGYRWLGVRPARIEAPAETR